MLKHFAASLFALAALLAGIAPAAAEKRVALVIGNSAYENVPRLTNPSNDAADVAAKLKRSASRWSKASTLASATWRSASGPSPRR